MALLSKLAQFSSHVMGSTHWTSLTKPECVFNFCTALFISFSCKLKYIPYSDKIHVVVPLPNCKMELNMAWNHYLLNEARILDPADPDVARVLRVFVKIIRALSDGLRLKQDCRVSANYNMPNRKLPEKHNVIVVPSRFGSKEIVSGGPMKFLGMKYDTKHLEGLDWEVMVVESGEEDVSYHGNGKIVLHDGMLSLTEEELAYTLAHEVGHGVAMHIEDDPTNALLFFFFLPRPIFNCLSEWVFYHARRQELEADYIGLMLMASAGYDPRVAPQFYKKYDDPLFTTHPSMELRAQMLSQEHVMGRAIKIYEQVQAGQEVPSFI